jgi:ATP-dependent Clp protease ATP-binding subunit ClpA
LGDNRRVDFSRTLIFMTSNLGAAEMSSILRPNLGFAAGDRERRLAAGIVDDGLAGKVDRAGLEAARRKFTPEFMNRIDKTVVFHPLGAEELRKVLNIELNQVQQRIFSTGNAFPFVFQVSNDSREFLLREGTDMKYGARHLKRAVDRLLVHPLSNLMATGQVRGGDLIRVDYDSSRNALTFFKDAEDMPSAVMAGMVDTSIGLPHEAAAAGMVVPLPHLSHGARSTKR